MAKLNISHIHPRWFSGISFLAQFFRVPLLLSLAVDSTSLALYFLVSLASIPFQFFSLEILQYRGHGKQFRFYEQLAIFVTLLITLVHVGITNGAGNLAWYSAFGGSLILYGLAIGRLRSVAGPHIVLLTESVVNATATVFIVLLALLIPSGMLSQAIIAVLLTLNAGIWVWTMRMTRPSHSHAVGETQPSSVAPLTAILITTQLERLVIVGLRSEFLTVISLAAGIVQAWRKVAMDDAIVFDRIARAPDDALGDTLLAEMRRGCMMFLPIALVCAIAYLNVDTLFRWVSQLHLLRSMTAETFREVPLLMCLYFSSLPCGIAMINALRDGRRPLGQGAWLFLIAVVGVELYLLSIGPLSTRGSLTVWVVMCLTASINLVLFVSVWNHTKVFANTHFRLASSAYFISVVWVVCQNIY